jgi:GTP-binding protein Era
MIEHEIMHSGYIAIVGRPNVGKSTLLNSLLQQKISITARKPQTTRHRILGIKTVANNQLIFVDTPGIEHRGKHALNRYMQQTVTSVLSEVDIVVFVVDGLIWKPDDEAILQMLKQIKLPVMLVINKIDTIKNKNLLLPYIQEVTKKHDFVEIIPLSAKNHTSVSVLEEKIIAALPPGPFFFPEEQVTDRDERFLVAEIIREKLTRLLGEEVPHELTVAVESFVTEEKIVRISAVIYVEKPGQKLIVIGAAGSKLKEVGTKARLDIEKMIGKKVFLQLWVKVKTGWSDSENTLRNLGYK